MQRRDAEKFLAKATGRVCGMYFRRADGTILTRDCPVGLRALRRRVSRVAATAFSAVFGLLTGSVPSTSVYAQKGLEGDNAKIERNLRRYGRPVVQGRVFDMTGAVILDATIEIINRKTKQKLELKTDEEGRFSIKELPAGQYLVKVYSRGFKSFQIDKFSLSADEKVTLDVTLMVGTVGGMAFLNTHNNERASAKLGRE